MKPRGDGTSAGHCPIHLMLALALLAAAGCEPPRPHLPHEDKLALVQTIVVLTFIDAPGPRGKGSGKIVVNAAIAEMYQCPGVSVVEAARLKAVMDELDLQRTDMVDHATAWKIGKRAGAELVIVGEITQYETTKDYSHGAVHMFSAGGTKTTHRVGLSLRGVSVKNGQVIYAKGGQGNSEKGYSPALELAAKEAIRPLALFFKERYEKAHTAQPKK